MKVQLPFIGNASGTTAGMIYQCYRGRTYMRAKPLIYHYPATPLQQASQAAFYNIQEQMLPIYEEVRMNVTKEQRGDLNLFNIISSGIYQAAETFDKAKISGPPRRFGIDTTDEVVIKTASTDYEVTDKTIRFLTVVKSLQTSRRFAPLKCFTIVINYKQQQLKFHYDDFSSSTIQFILPNDSLWSSEFPLRFYIALSDDNFFSNFTLCHP